jgi:hypothetical protein
MSRLLSRVLLAILMFPLAGVVYLVTFAILEDAGNGGREYLVMAGGVTWMFVVAYWFSLWHAGVQWTPKRIRETIVSTIGALFVAIVLGRLLYYLDRSVGTFVGSVLAPLLWLVGTVFVWRDDGKRSAVTAGDAASVVCPACSYSMTGLTEARCPECGSRFTLDELFANQPQQRATADLK